MTWATKFVNDTGLDISAEKNILNYSDEAWAPLRVSIFFQQILQTNSKQNMKASYTRTPQRSLTKGQ